MKAHSSGWPTDFSPNVSENWIVKAHSFPILGEKYHIYLDIDVIIEHEGPHGRKRPTDEGPAYGVLLQCPSSLKASDQLTKFVHHMSIYQNLLPVSAWINYLINKFFDIIYLYFITYFIYFIIQIHDCLIIKWSEIISRLIILFIIL